MKKAKLLPILLTMSLLVTFSVPISVAAETGDDVWQISEGMNFRKTAEKNEDGGYDITLEAYATGSKVVTEITEDIPTDIVLVIDQSGSMRNNMNTQGFRAYTGRNNSYFFERRHNGGSNNLYYQLPDGGYASVSVSRTETLTYTPFANGTPNDDPLIGAGRVNYYNNSNNLYALVGSEYQKVTVDGDLEWLTRVYTYKLPNGTTIATSRGRDTVPNFTGITGNVLYTGVVDQSQSVYTYTYTDSNNVLQTIGTSTGVNTQPTDFILYESYITGTITRLQALKTATNTFATSVAEKSKGEDSILGTADDINHRIAIVGFASNITDYNRQQYENTEVFIGATQYLYNQNPSTQYGNAFQSMNTQTGINNVNASINALDAEGGTFTNLGMEMANGILQANPVPAGQQRNRVVVVFTDGIPGASGYDANVANAAIEYGNTIKSAGATIYTIGVFEGADAGSAGSATGSNQIQRANWFMQHLSSGGGSPNSGYYLSTTDANSLNGIFEQISHNIETGGSSTTLTEESVIRDIIAPAFSLPDGATASDITLETWACTGIDNNGNYTWLQNSDAMGAAVVIDSTDSSHSTTTNNRVSVTGFDFAENYVGTVTENDDVSYRGHKLVISFTVTPREGFFGGNGVRTNAGAGIYEDGDAANPVLTFDQPVVDVPLAVTVVNVPSANVYLGAYYSQTIPEDAVKMGATVTIGDYELDFSKANDENQPYGLEPWQMEYINIDIQASTTDNSGTFINIREDIDYSVIVTVSPKYPSSTGSEDTIVSASGTIHVFKPKLTFKDSEVWYGEKLPENYMANAAHYTWLNSEGSISNSDEGVVMLNEEPELMLSYTPDAGKIYDGNIASKQDIPVKVEVKIPMGPAGAQVEEDITSDIIFDHEACDPACEWTAPTTGGDPAFLLHVNTCSLTINKTGGAEGEPYVFSIFKDGSTNPYTYASITANDEGKGSVMISELPIGSYSIAENTAWSWRYTPTYVLGGSNTNTITLSADNANGTLQCANISNNKNKWLNGYSLIAQNIYGVDLSIAD